MLFIDDGGRIVYIAADAAPESTTEISAGRKVRAVLEINGGAAKAQGIAVGDKVVSHYFEGGR